MIYTAGELTVAGAIWNAIKWTCRLIHKTVTITRWIVWYTLTAILIFLIIVRLFGL